ncbi:MAG: helix-turn-helix domain-containing protein [Christensenellales bacterium]
MNEIQKIFDFDIKIFAERLKELRIEKGVGQNKLAEDLDLSNASISYWENAKQEPTASAIYKLAKYFNVSTDYLLGLSD